jgi:SAM-dependent methyltransferase
MKLPGWRLLPRIARRSRDALRRTLPSVAPAPPEPLAGQFQIYSHTLPHRYPWLFGFAAQQLARDCDLKLLSFGCSRGDEVFALRSYFPLADIKGIDVDPRNIALCEARARAEKITGVSFQTAATTLREASASYDAIFCLAVLCLGDLTTSGVQHCDPRLYFDDFERLVADFSRCLKPSALLLLHTTNFRFSDTRVAREFDTLLEATPDQMAPDVQFDRNNRLIHGPRYRAVAFRKRAALVAPA